jgi:hypothetical protein
MSKLKRKIKTKSQLLDELNKSLMVYREHGIDAIDLDGDGDAFIGYVFGIMFALGEIQSWAELSWKLGAIRHMENKGVPISLETAMKKKLLDIQQGVLSQKFDLLVKDK